MILTIMDFFEDVAGAIAAIKDLIISFYKIVTTIFTLIPQPYGAILGIALTIILAIIIIGIVRG